MKMCFHKMDSFLLKTRDRQNVCEVKERKVCEVCIESSCPQNCKRECNHKQSQKKRRRMTPCLPNTTTIIDSIDLAVNDKSWKHQECHCGTDKIQVAARGV